MSQNLTIDNIHKKDLTHQFRDMELLSTIYGKLFHRYRFRAKSLDLLLFISGLIFCSLVLVDPKLLENLQISAEQQGFLLRIDSISLFILTILAFTNNWKEKAALYRQAETTLAIMKTDCQEVLKFETQEQLNILSPKKKEYQTIINRLPSIPEQAFYRLKTYHKRRQELNRMLEAFPGSSVGLLRIFIYSRANLNLLLRKPFLSQSADEN